MSYARSGKAIVEAKKFFRTQYREGFPTFAENDVWITLEELLNQFAKLGEGIEGFQFDSIGPHVYAPGETNGVEARFINNENRIETRLYITNSFGSPIEVRCEVTKLDSRITIDEYWEHAATIDPLLQKLCCETEAVPRRDTLTPELQYILRTKRDLGKVFIQQHGYFGKRYVKPNPDWRSQLSIMLSAVKDLTSAVNACSRHLSDNLDERYLY